MQKPFVRYKRTWSVDSLIQKELDKGYLIGPFQTSLFNAYRVNPIGVATRKYSL